MKRPLLPAAVLCAGTASFGAMLGFVTGASSTPVAGTLTSAIIAGVLGLGAGKWGRTAGDKDAAPAAVKLSPWPAAAHWSVMATLGMVLLSFSPAFICGVMKGAYLRVHPPFDPPSVKAPWDASSAPSDTGVAWEWMKLAMQASENGMPADAVPQAYARSARPRQLPWAGQKPPASVEDAVRWMAFADVAERNGLTGADIASVYALASGEGQTNGVAASIDAYLKSYAIALPTTGGTSDPGVRLGPRQTVIQDVPTLPIPTIMDLVSGRARMNAVATKAVPEPSRRGGDVFNPSSSQKSVP